MFKKLLIVFLAFAAISPVFALANQGSKNENGRGFGKEVREMAKDIKSDKTLGQVDIACVQKAVTIREDGLISALDTFSASTKSALVIRKQSLLNAWAKTDATERRASRKDAYEAYRLSMKKAHQVLNTSKKTAWNTFNTEVRKCSGAENYTEKSTMDFLFSL